MEKRINPQTGKLEVKLQPEGLPVLWVEILCSRCEEYKECLGLKELSEEEWEEVNHLLKEAEDLSWLSKRGYDKKCTAL